MERVTPVTQGALEANIPEADFHKAFEAAVKVLTSSILRDGKGRAKPGDVYPPDPTDVYPPDPTDVYPPDPTKSCKLIEEIRNTAHVNHHAARVAIGHATRAFHTAGIAALVAKCPDGSN
jgi:hypothetical protein